MDTQKIYDAVKERYSASSKASGDAYAARVAKAFGYTEEELANVPKDANLGLSCGNPLVLAKLKEGETVVDLGSGAGFDVFLAARSVGRTGKAIGIDMNPDMLAKANLNKQKSNVQNAEFVESMLTSINLPDSTADVIISNCVINLVPEPDKPQAFKEMFRLLKSGGRVAVSDILAKKLLPEKLKNSMALYVGCVAGASQGTEYEKYLTEAGFKDILIVDAQTDLNVYIEENEDGTLKTCCGAGDMTEEEAKAACCQPKAACCDSKGDVRDALKEFKNIDFNEWAGSYKIYAIKP